MKGHFAPSALILACALLLGLTSCESGSLEPSNPTRASPLASLAPLSPTSPLPTAVRPSPVPTDDDIMPTAAPTPTPPPVPTPLPTPVVTPIPTAVPPLVPEVVDKAQQPFWIIYWQGNEIWRIDDQGKERQLLLDTYKRLGLYLTANPYLEYLVNTSPESRVAVSPDGQELALVLIDKPGLVHQREQFTFSIYLFEIPSNKLTFLSQGASPIWSPDGKRLTFVRGDTTPDGFLWDSGLWIADLETGQIYPLVKGYTAIPALYVSYWAWSLDGQQIAYRYRQDMIDQPEIWIKSVADSSSPYLIPNIPADIYYWFFSWMPGGRNLLCGTLDEGRPELPMKLWAVSVKTGEPKQLTQGFYGGAGPWSPDGKWMAFSAIRAYERERQPYDLWLLSVDGTQLLRVTSAPPQDIGPYWSPDGTRLVFRREGTGLVILSLQTGNVNPLGVNLPDLASNNYAVGGSK